LRSCDMNAIGDPAWGILLRTVGQIWVFLRVCFLRWWSNTTKKTKTCNFGYRHL